MENGATKKILDIFDYYMKTEEQKFEIFFIFVFFSEQKDGEKHLLDATFNQS